MFARCTLGSFGIASKLSVCKNIASRACVANVHTLNHIPILNANMESMRVYLEPSTGKKPTCSVIMLHGLGDTAFYMVPYAADLSRSLPSTRFVCPTAHEIPLRCREGALQHAWFDFPSWSLEGNDDCRGVEDSCKVVDSLIEKEIKKGIDPKHIVLCGFSQGAGIALHAAYNRKEPIGGVIAFCGCLPNPSRLVVQDSAKDTPVMFFHGTEDPRIPYQFMEGVSTMLKQKGVKDVEFNLYPGQKHHISRRMIDLSRTFLEGVEDEK